MTCEALDRLCFFPFVFHFIHQLWVCHLYSSLTDPFPLGLSDREAPAAPFSGAREGLADRKPISEAQMGKLESEWGLASGPSVSHWQRGSQLPCFCIHYSLATGPNNRVICEARRVTHQAGEESVHGMIWCRGANYLIATGEEVLT